MANAESQKPVAATSKMRWKILRDVVLKQVSDVTATSSSTVSVRRFRGFGIFNVEKSPSDFSSSGAKQEEEGMKCEWYVYSFAEDADEPAAKKVAKEKEDNEVMYVRQLTELPKATDLIGFDNTGNVCVWPAEEVLAQYCVQNSSKLFNEKSVVLELGGGMTCLAGLAIARFVQCARVYLTDGNERSVKNLSEIIGANRQRSLLKAECVEAQTLRWDMPDRALHDACDVLVCADCLFYDAYRQSLALCIARCLKLGGVAVLFAPRRGRTMAAFLQLFEDAALRSSLAEAHADVAAEAKFEVSVSERHLEHVWSQHVRLSELKDPLYDPDIHYPLLILIKKLASTSQSKVAPTSTAS